jgi:hypothetical protein
LPWIDTYFPNRSTGLEGQQRRLISMNRACGTNSRRQRPARDQFGLEILGCTVGTIPRKGLKAKIASYRHDKDYDDDPHPTLHLEPSFAL